MAILPARPKSMNGKMARWQDGRKERGKRARTAAVSSPPAPGEVVQRPVERRVDDLEGVPGDELLFRRQQLRPDERQHGALDRAASGERLRRGVRVGSHELLLAPREDRADFDLAGVALNL